MKRIVFTVTNDLIFDQRMARICNTLATEGFEVMLLGRKWKISEKLTPKAYIQRRLTCFFNKGKLFYIEFNIRLFFSLLFIKADIICANDLDTLTAAFLASRLKKTKLFYDSHEYYTEVIELVKRPLVRKIWLMIEELFVPKTDRAYTVSESLQRVFEEKYKIKFDLIRNMPLLEEHEIIVQKEEKYIIYAGVLNAGRGLEETIEAMKFIDCKLLICGDGDILEQLKQMVNELHLNNKVIFHGAVQPEELRAIIRKAYLGILLLRNESLNYYYSLANKFFDYMHAGIPQITIDFPEYRVINEKYKVSELIDLNVEDIVRSVNKLLSDHVYYDELSSNALKAKKVFNWQKESQTLIEIYKSNGNL
jgi:glycosyltransferase involved in cell wall biosynthesis